MPDSDTPTRVIARIYHVAWVIMVTLLVGAGIMVSAGRLVGIEEATRASLTQLLVQGYFLLLPAGILCFAVMMAVRKYRPLALICFALTLIWVASKLLG